MNTDSHELPPEAYLREIRNRIRSKDAVLKLMDSQGRSKPSRLEEQGETTRGGIMNAIREHLTAGGSLPFATLGNHLRIR